MLHGYGPSLLQGAALTLALAGAALLLALALGLAGAVARLSRSALASRLALAYTTLVRGVPDLVLMLLIFYGGQIAINEVGDRLGWGYVDIDPYLAGVLTLGFIFGAYVAEVLRGAILSVPPGQAEAALALGFTRAQVLWRIVGPQMLRHALPGLSNNWLVMLKSTAIVSVIGLQDLSNRAAQAAGNTGAPFVFYGAVALAYLAFTSLSELGFAWLRRRLSPGQAR
ncbi:histidine/lysine/arginine/ornithine transporter subunit; membrane component of ABC superfamily [Rubrivivax sp. A210]|uniref:ABC transporter permease n=1 Tax=Rubrivivax sp. A210 TaxID=2772301 RepID=UPI00191A33BA|nr:ABC transporter permease subunit [Rubrivivax sp. A210]CAD5375140.1 histidine/lysine/arginine/ornithine transporter subunit; membrane component of ABC superfamily [Rubrivivax sp. A210]